ncbi:retrovirus-related pol polyprotein from transposon TNT 1-94 [Tanacetum coccineum]
MAVPVSTREPRNMWNQSVATSSKKTVATDSTVKKFRNTTRKIYEQVSKTCSWWYPKYTPPEYNWKPKSQIGNVNPNVSMPLGNASRTANILEHKTPRTVKFGNDQIAHFIGYWRSVQGIRYYLKRGNDLLTGSRGTDLYSITLQDSTTPNPICLMAKATSSQACWGKAIESLFTQRLHRAPKDGYNFYTLTYVVPCGSKDETPGVLIDFLTLVQRGLHAQVTTVRTDKGTEFLNKTLHAYFAKEGIRHETSTARTPEQNGIVERWNRTLVEAARTMLSAAKVPLFFWAEAIANSMAFYSKPISLVILSWLKSDKIEGKSTPVQEQGETSSRHVDSSNMHTFYQHHPSTQRWTKDHPLEQVIGNPSQSVRNDVSFETDGEMLYVRTHRDTNEPKIHQRSMAVTAWIVSMQEEIHQFDRLDSCGYGDMLKRKELISKSHLHQLLGWKLRSRDCVHLSRAAAHVLCLASSCNPVQHSRTEHIDVRYHFIKNRFKYLVRDDLGMRMFAPDELEVWQNESAGYIKHHLWFTKDELHQMTSVHNSSGLNPQCQMTFDHNSHKPRTSMSYGRFEQNVFRPSHHSVVQKASSS